ncbi:MAG: hypothetical protein EHM51_01805, partial [Geobacter sp.]
MKLLRFGLIAVVLFIFPALSGAFEAGFARISLVEGEVLVKTEESSGWLPAAVNTPLYEGDSIWSPEGSRAEIQLQNNSYVRLNARSNVNILALDKELQQFHLGSGQVYVRTGNLRDNGLQIDVNDTAVKVYDKARFRVDIAEDGDEEVSLFKGNAYVEGSSGRTRLRTGEMLTVEGSSTELGPLNPPDEWEHWNRDRDRKVAGRKADSRYLPEELAAYAGDLDANGQWIQESDYGYVWRPTVIVSADWSPYQVGRWVWRGDDYIWISHESWGWAPYHYGRWVVLPGRGWCWVPPARADVFWSPGYVGWVTTPAYVGWVPLAPGELYYGRGYYGRHSVNVTTVNINTRITNVTYRNVTVNNALTVVRRDSFAAGKAERVRVRENLFTRGNGMAGRPNIKPVGREARMPVVRPISPAALPPARVANVPIRELRERHPRVIDRQGGSSPVAGKVRGPVQNSPRQDRGSIGRQKSTEKESVDQPRTRPVRQEAPKAERPQPVTPAQAVRPSAPQTPDSAGHKEGRGSIGRQKPVEKERVDQPRTRPVQQEAPKVESAQPVMPDQAVRPTVPQRTDAAERGEGRGSLGRQKSAEKERVEQPRIRPVQQGVPKVESPRRMTPEQAARPAVPQKTETAVRGEGRDKRVWKIKEQEGQQKGKHRIVLAEARREDVNGKSKIEHRIIRLYCALRRMHAASVSGQHRRGGDGGYCGGYSGPEESMARRHRRRYTRRHCRCYPGRYLG